MWHKYCYIVLSRVSMQSFCNSDSAQCIFEMKRCEPSLFEQKTHKCYLCEINSALSEEKCLERAENYFNKLSQSMQYSLETVIYLEKSCSVALLFCNVPLKRVLHSLNMVVHSFKKMQHCFGIECLNRCSSTWKKSDLVNQNYSSKYKCSFDRPICVYIYIYLSNNSQCVH